MGGGVIGCAVAYHLALAGVKATVLEREQVAAEATGAAAGMLAPLAEARSRGPFLDLALASLRLFPSEVDELQQRSGVDIEYMPSGLLRLALSAADEEELRGRLAWQEGLGLPLEWLGREEVLSLEPRLTPRLLGAIYSPQESQVNPERLALAYARAAAARGATLHPSVRVTGLLRRGDCVEGVRTSHGRIAADHTVLAAGAWTPTLARPLGWELPIRPTRGQMIAVGGISQPVRHMVWGRGAYMAPKANNFLFVGATVEEVGFRKRTTTRARAWLERMSRLLVPSLAHAQVADHWAGLRPGTVDRMPILGPLPGWRGVSVASGHFRNGILLAPITGRLAARWITVGETEPSLAPFSPQRFAAQIGQETTSR
ncbi:MAG: glycine oxidase ThiO [Dehalococcoidia bacterium]